MPDATALDQPALPADLNTKRFLTKDRVRQIGELVAPLIWEDMSWVERRKESVEVLDDSALRRQISVDFSLRGSTKPLLPNSGGDSLYCAPIYVLPKAPSNLMSFNLEDESGRSLTLINRGDNAHVSAAALIAMAEQLLGTDLPNALANKLEQIATADADAGVELAAKLLSQKPFPWTATLDTLAASARFVWWLRTLAHSSLVVVLFRAPEPRRKLVKLSFEQPIAAKQRWLTRLGWTPYRVGVDSPLIEARSFHLEAQSPPGLRISSATLNDDSDTNSVSDAGFLRRVHLYRPEAQMAGAGTTVLWLSVSGPGFIGGALLASVLTTFALGACWYAASAIGTTPTSAPALLLALPALIASYVARPDQHALTTKLLSGARWLLLFAAFLAYGSAAFVTLGRSGNLRLALGVAALLSLIPLAGLAITWAQNRRQTINRLSFSNRCFDSCFVAASADEVFTHLDPATQAPVELKAYESIQRDANDKKLLFLQQHWHGTWVVTLQMEPSDGGCVMSASSERVSRLRGVPFTAWLLNRRQATEIAGLLKSVRNWAAGSVSQLPDA